MKIFCCNLPYEIGVPALRGLFAEYGQVRYVHVLRDQATDKPLGRAVVTMRFTEDAERAISELRGSTFGDRKLVCCKHERSLPLEAEEFVL